MIKQTYISCPLSIPSEDLEKVIKLVKGYNLNRVHWYGRSTAYDTEVYDTVIDKSDAFILVLPGMVWSIAVKDLTAGCKREYGRAMIDAKKQLFIAYKRMNGEISIYQAITQDGIIRGVTGSVNVFQTAVAEGNRHTKENEEMAAKAPQPTPAQEKAASKLKDYFGIGDDYFEDQPIIGRYDVAKYARSDIRIFQYANQLFNSNPKMGRDDYHNKIDAFAESVRQQDKAMQLAVAYGSKPSQRYDDYVEKIRKDWIAGMEVHEISDKHSLAPSYVSATIDRNRSKIEWGRKVAKDTLSAFQEAMIDQSLQKYREELSRYLGINKPSKTGLNYHELLKKHLEHRTPAQEQPLAALLPKEGDKVESSGYIVEHKDGKWEWEIKNPDYIDERLVIFF